MPIVDGTSRFSSRVDNYLRFRPGYPREIIQLLRDECGFNSGTVVADIAFGTGLFTRLLLEQGSRVFGVEPNPEMRRAGEEFLSGFPNFISVSGTAEHTSLPDHSIDIVTAAQAAHWFNVSAARIEFARILKAGGWLVLVWNDRQLDTNDFQRQYEQLVVKYGTDYEEIRQEGAMLAVQKLFENSSYQTREFEYEQNFDYRGLEGRLLSSSYIPQPGHENHLPMLRKLRKIFDQRQINGKISFAYTTRVYYGQLR